MFKFLCLLINVVDIIIIIIVIIYIVLYHALLKVLLHTQKKLYNINKEREMLEIEVKKNTYCVKITI